MCENECRFTHMSILQWFSDSVLLIPLPWVAATQHQLCPSMVPPRKLVWRGSMTQYESCLTHLENLCFFFHNQTQHSTEWNHHLYFSRWIICSNSDTQLYRGRLPQTGSLGEQRCIENLRLGWLFLLRPMCRFVILFNYRIFTFHIMSTLM